MLERHQLRGAHPQRVGDGTDDHRGVTREPREEVARLVEQVLERAVRGGEEVGDGAPLAHGKRSGCREVVDEVAVALIGGDPTRRRVRLGEEALPLELGHVVAHRGARHPEVARRGDGLGRDRLGGEDVLLHHRLQDGRPSLRCIHRVLRHSRFACPESLSPGAIRAE